MALAQPDINTMRQRLVEAVDRQKDLISDIAVSLYERPEVGLSETFACSKLTAILESSGFDVKLGLAGLPTAFSARRGSGRPAIAFLAEYDALLGIGHGCGHNLIAACAVASALACQSVLPAEEAGVSWLVVGTPAEETVGGKIAMVEAGVFDDLDAAFIAHPGQRHSVGGGTYWASHPLEIEFTGKPSHAGGSPWDGINALDACVAAYMAIRNLRNHLRDDTRIAGIIVHGGDAQNIVPDRAVMRFTLRSTDHRYLEEVIIPKVKRCAEGAASMVGAGIKFRHHEPLYRETLEYPVLKELARRQFNYLGQEVPEPPPGGSGGVTDVGNVTWVLPCIQIGFAMTDAPGHTREMAQDTISARGIEGAVLASKVLALCALELVLNRELLREAWNYLWARLQPRHAHRHKVQSDHFQSDQVQSDHR